MRRLGGLIVMVGLIISVQTVRAASQSAKIVDFSFEPTTLNVAVGDSVTWTNTGSAPHTVTSLADADKFDSGILNSGGTFTYSFKTAGSFDFQCNVHPRMVGTVVVAAAPAQPAQPAAPATPAQPAQPAAPTLPASGAAANIPLLWLMLGGSVILLAGIVVRRRVVR